MTQKEQITEICKRLFEEQNALFIGYNVAKGSMMYGTLSKLPENALQEMPCAENLIAGSAIGIAIEGSRLPVVCFERHEFAVFALGQLAVMADKLHAVTDNIRVPMIVRIIKGAERPLDPGAQHKGNYGVSLMESMPNSVFLFARFGITYDGIVSALKSSKSGIVVIMEERDEYEQTAA